MQPRATFCSLLIALLCVSAIAEETEFGSELDRGQKAALMHGTSADSSSLGAISYLLAVSKDNWKHSLGYRLGFSVAAMRRAASFAGSQGLSAGEKELLNGAFTIFSGEAMLVKIKLHVSDAKMTRFFGPRVNGEIAGPRPFPDAR
jgi:hypothetical protein